MPDGTATACGVSVAMCDPDHDGLADIATGEEAPAARLSGCSARTNDFDFR